MVSTLRMGIRALPALTQVLDLELSSATVTLDSVVGAELSLQRATLSSNVKLSQISLPSRSQEKEIGEKAGHKRFGSVIQWNARLKNSLRRSWDRAWGTTEVQASVALTMENLLSQASRSLVATLKITPPAEEQMVFCKIPSLTLDMSARLDPHQGIHQHTLELALGLDTIMIDYFVLDRVLQVLKTNEMVNPGFAAPARVLGSPRSPRVAWASSISGNSPLMGVLSASMRFRRNLKKPPVRKLDTRAIVSKLSSLKSVQLNVTQITIKHRAEIGPDRNTATLDMTLRRVNINAALSHPDRNPLHREWLGRNAAPGDPLSANVYAFGLSIREITLDRIGSGAVSDHLRLVGLGPLTVEAVASQWPAPWLRGPTFMTGDPNAQVLLIQVSLDKVEVTERLEVLQAFLERRKSTKVHPGTKPSLPEILSPVPRIQLGIHVGSVCAGLISPTPEVNGKPFALELRTDGFVLTAQSQFFMLLDNQSSKEINAPDYPRIRMDFGFHLVLQRTFVTTRMGVHADFEDHILGISSLPGEPVFSLDILQIMSNGRALGHAAEVPGIIVFINTSSMYMRTQISADALSIELWQPDAIVALTATAHALTATPSEPAQTASGPLLDRMPSGLDVSLSVARLMLYVTGKDLTPDDDLGISRGLATRTGLSLHYCSLTGQHIQHIKHLTTEREIRLKMSLPDEPISTAYSRTTTPGSDPAMVAVFLQAKVWKVALRDAVATPLAADEPYGFEDSGVPDGTKEYLTIREIVVDAAISGYRDKGLPRNDTAAHCHAAVSVSSVRGALQLAQIYNMLLAAHTVSRIVPTQTRAEAPSPRVDTIHFSLSYSVDHAHLLWDFPLKSRLYTRMRSISGKITPEKHHRFSWKSAILATTVDREEDGKPRVRWEEVARLLNFTVDVLPDVKPTSIAVVGDSARLRIPFGFVLADFILDINISIKCVKHLVHMVPSGQYSNPLTPEAEEAKVMPDLVMRIGCLSAEAADEDLESRLALIWRAGFEASRLRHEREEAFRAKVATILAAEKQESASRDLESDFQFSSEHTISIAEARERLDRLHAGTWKSRFRQAHVHQQRREQMQTRKTGGTVPLYGADEDDMVVVRDPLPVPPLFRITLDQLSLRLTGPSFPSEGIPEFLFNEGGGLPRDTQYSLLVPMHLSFSVSSLRVAYREYPLPLLNIPPHSNENRFSLEFDSDVIIAEEMGTAHSVYWVDCAILQPDVGIYGASPLTIPVPKTIMPVKSYAKPVVRVTTDNVSDFAWGVSYSPATQDFMRIVDTLSHAPRDQSPPIGFWDKLRLIFHWRLRVYFDHEVHLHMKGSRDPHDLRGSGPGFALCWRGRPKLLIGQPNEQKELFQVLSDSMLITVPNMEESFGEASTAGTRPEPAMADRPQYHLPGKSRKYRKVCAKFTSGVRFGIGIALERSCGPECLTCSGRPFQRKCRFFNFRPHYEVMLEQKPSRPIEKSLDDSYNTFRSDFIHLSLSLASSTSTDRTRTFSSIHLSPKLFAHFWAWWTLFDFKALPIRQGGRYNYKRPLSPKFGQHLATIKYRIVLPKLFISHAYMDESSDAWVDGVTPFVGVKAMIDTFQADMHQRSQESTITTPNSSTKTVEHKPFYAVEVVMKGLELRALLAIFSEPLKQRVPLESSPLGSAYRTRENIPVIKPDSVWIDLDDFVEIDWSSEGIPVLHLLPAVFCPRFTYFKRAQDKNVSGERIDVTKFGNENTHVCLLGTESSVPEVQIDLVEKRILELRELLMRNGRESEKAGIAQTNTDARKMIPLLENYVKHLHKVDAATRRTNNRHSYYMPSDSVSPQEWSEFSNVYQVHNPQLFMDNIMRDTPQILLQYYYCSRARKGLEYHMASRALKFIRDQADMAIDASKAKAEKGRESASSAHAAAMAVRRMFTGEGASRVERVHESDSLDNIDPMSGWSEDVALQKSHFCLLLKPQIVLRSEADSEAVCIMAAVQGKLQSYGILDIAHADDPISGNVMTRNFASINGLQTFSPSATNKGEGCVPLEVLIDLRCDNSLFDRLVPQTDATFHYDKFNRLRMQSKVMSVARPSDRTDPMHDHLQNQTDLIRFHVPRFTISANDRHFQAISDIVTNLLLFSDAAAKTRSDRLDKMIFSYDFTDLSSAADVVSSLQVRLRNAVEMKKEAEWKLQGFGEEGEIEKLKIEAHVLMVAEELDLVFDAIRLAQEKAEDRAGQKSALLLHASSSEISYRMLDRKDQLLAKLAVRDIDFYWLNRQDSSTLNNLSVGDLQAFDGAADAEWTEILSKYEEKSNHPCVKLLVQQNLFLLADWTVLPPVGGITIYEAFELTLHPIRLQIDTRVGRRIMEYVWPARRTRKQVTTNEASQETPASDSPTSPRPLISPRRNSVDAVPVSPRKSLDSNRLAPPPMRRLNTSRSFTDLRKSARSDTLQVPRQPHRTHSTDMLFTAASSGSSGQASKGSDETKDKVAVSRRDIDDASEMKYRSSQKTFVWVKVASLHLLLSIMKENSFLCRDARIHTRDLEYRNQTWSFEELVDQFIPSGRNWKGWLKMAFQQPLVPVLPVARELISKTKWGGAKAHHPTTHHHPSPGIRRKDTPKLLPFFGHSRDKGNGSAPEKQSEGETPEEILDIPFSTEPEPVTAVPIDGQIDKAKTPRARMLSMFKRHHGPAKVRSSVDSDVSVTSTSSISTTQSAPPTQADSENSDPSEETLASI
ncbi:unnamed protein product [Somion occarium]|uniref:Uncharacterized protein n=1 Tax=Somion occarium TaxID=3059160 RepID=A0ABP1D1E8_9APHY